MTKAMHIVLLPGMDGTGELFAPLVDAFPEGVEVIVVSYPRDEVLGWDELVAFVEGAVPVGEAYCLVAESFSGPVAIRFASRKPPGLEGLILCASFCRNPLPRGLGWLARLAKPVAFKRRPPSGFLRRYLLGPSAGEELLDSVRRAIGGVSPGVMAARVSLAAAVDVAGDLDGVDVPILYLQASEDRLVGGRGWSQIHAVKPNASLVGLAGPHLLLQCKPKEASIAILEFATRVHRKS